MNKTNKHSEQIKSNEEFEYIAAASLEYSDNDADILFDGLDTDLDNNIFSNDEEFLGLR